MKKNLYLLIFIASAISLTSCVSTNKGYQSSPVLSRNVQLDPIKADINVNTVEKLKGESSAAYLFGLRVSGDRAYADGVNYSTDVNASLISKINPLNAVKTARLTKVRGAAAYNAHSRGDYDVLVHPTYTVVVKNYLVYKEYRVEVQGYGSTYSNFRTEKQKVVITDNTREYIFSELPEE